MAATSIVLAGAIVDPRRAPPTVVTAILLTLARLIVQFMRRNL
jgi:hypothetical protein